MPEIRYDVLSGNYAVIATERAKRPTDFSSAQETTDLPEFDEKCPFCPGNEQMTPPEVYALRTGGTKDTPGWSVRVVPNKFPALSGVKHMESGATKPPGIDDFSLYWTMPGIGAHEVVVESALHNGTLGTYTLSEMTDIISVLRDRSLSLYEKEEIKYVQVFRNSEAAGGASLSHPHFQIIALPLVPGKIQNEISRIKEYEVVTGRCMLCDFMEREAGKDARVVRKTDEFITICPFASTRYYETMIVPRKHSASFCRIGIHDLEALAQEINILFGKYEKLFSSLPYNLVLHSAPPEKPGNQGWSYHWHVHIYPRLNIEAGLELGTGVYINPTPPEIVARSLS